MTTTVAAAAAPGLKRRACSPLDRPFMGTDLTMRAAIMTFAAGPIVWAILDLAWAALPA